MFGQKKKQAKMFNAWGNLTAIELSALKPDLNTLELLMAVSVGYFLALAIKAGCDGQTADDIKNRFIDYDSFSPDRRALREENAKIYTLYFINVYNTATGDPADLLMRQYISLTSISEGSGMRLANYYNMILKDHHIIR